MTEQFKAAPWGTRVRVISVVVTVLLLGIIPTIIFSIPVLVSLMQWLILGLMAFILAVTALFLVRGYALADKVLIVQRTFWVTRIKLDGLKSAVADPQALQGAWKTVGNDGVFAIHGWFRSKRLGKFRAFVTDPSRAVVLDLGLEKVVLSPAEPDSFVNADNRCAGHSAR